MKPPKSASEASESTVRWWSCPGFVYFMAAGDPPVAIKIGMAAQTGENNLRSAMMRRLSQIQSANHEQVYLLGILYFTEGDFPTRDAEAYERELHLEFQHLRRFAASKRGAEWFSPSSELLARIEELVTKPEELDLPRSVSAALVTRIRRA